MYGPHDPFAALVVQLYDVDVDVGTGLGEVWVGVGAAGLELAGAGLELAGAGLELAGAGVDVVGEALGDGVRSWWRHAWCVAVGAVRQLTLCVADRAAGLDDDARLSCGVQPAVAAAMAAAVTAAAVMALGLDSLITSSCLS